MAIQSIFILKCSGDGESRRLLRRRKPAACALSIYVVERRNERIQVSAD